MSINTHISGNDVEIRIEGRFDFNVHREFRDAYRNTPGPDSRYTVDMRNVDYMDSAALGMLLLLREHAGGQTAKVSLSNCRNDVRRILEIANFQKLFTLS